MDQAKRRVVITGMGALTPIGNDVESFWEGLMQGRSGAGEVTQFDASNLSTRIAAEVKDFNPADFMDRKDARRMDRFAQLAVAASQLALEHAAIDLDQIDRDRAGVLIGSGIGGIRTLEEQCRNLVERGPGRISPFFVPMMIPDMASGQVSIRFGLRGHNSCSVTACASGTNSLGDAYRVIVHGDADLMISGGAEAAVTELSMGGFASAKALSARNDEPEKASRPFDSERDGFLLGEGAGILVLEELEHAKRRGARIYAEVIGYAGTADAHHITMPAPEGDGAARAMINVLKDANLAPEDVDYINAHGTSTPYNDLFETLAIKRVFGDHAHRLAVSSTKSMTGHLLGAAGGVEAIVCALTIDRGIIPPTMNYENPDADCDLDYVPNKPREARVDVAISNSFGFGGHNAVLAFRRFEE